MPIDFDTGSYVPKLEGRSKISSALLGSQYFNFPWEQSEESPKKGISFQKQSNGNEKLICLSASLFFHLYPMTAECKPSLFKFNKVACLFCW